MRKKDFKVGNKKYILTKKKIRRTNQKFLHFKDWIYISLQFEVGMLLYVSGFRKFNKHYIEYKEDEAVVST